MINGSLVALVTPFDSEMRVDHQSLGKLIEWHIASDTAGIVVAGTTGEASTLSIDEHISVVETSVKTAGGRVPIIAGAGSSSTSEAIELLHQSEAVGCDGTMIVTPYYNKPSQSAIYNHFKILNDEANKPIIIYNIPRRCGVDIHVETMAKLSQLKSIVGVKDATADIPRVVLQRSMCESGFTLLSGDDFTSLAFNAHGGVGCVSVAANVYPKLCAQFQRCCSENDFNRACDFMQSIHRISEVLFSEPNPAPAKYILSQMGLCENVLRMPMQPVSRETEVVLANLLTEYKKWNH